MTRLREKPVAVIGDLTVKYTEDYLSRMRTDSDGIASDIELSSADAVKLILEKSAWICIRPSGTEPKIKIYCAVRPSTREEAEIHLRKGCAIQHDTLPHHLRCHQNDPLSADMETRGIFSMVFTNDRMVRNSGSLVNNSASNAAVFADVNVGQHNAILHHAAGFNTGSIKDNRAFDTCSGNDAAATDQ